MNKIHLVMLMAGGGTRFKKEGFAIPKPLIPLQGKPFFYWAVRSITKFMDVQDITFVVLQEHVEKFSIRDSILSYFPAAKIRVIPHVLNGAVLSAVEGVEGIKDNLPVLFNDCDHAFICQPLYDFCHKGNFDTPDGALLTFASQSPNFSYVQFDAAGQVTGTVEKKVVSREAICGAYYFRNKTLFLRAAQSYREHCAYNEFYMSGLYNEMSAGRASVRTFPVDVHITFGTPKELEIAERDERLGRLL